MVRKERTDGGRRDSAVILDGVNGSRPRGVLSEKKEKKYVRSRACARRMNEESDHIE